MKLKEGFIIRTVGGKKVAVATGSLATQFKGMITLNPTAAVIFETLAKGCSGIDEITEKITSAFDVDEQTARADVEKTVERLEGLGLIETE